jgi:ribonuclease Y
VRRIAITTIGVSIVFCVVGCIVGYLIRKHIAEGKIGTAEERAVQIVKEAEKNRYC